MADENRQDAVHSATPDSLERAGAESGARHDAADVGRSRSLTHTSGRPVAARARKLQGSAFRPL
jgi:hypothetical protein